MENKASRPANLQESKLLKTSDSINNGGKSQKNGRKRENYSAVLWNPGVGNVTPGPSFCLSKNQKSWQGKQKGSDKRQPKSKVGFGGVGANRKTDSEVSCTDPDVELLLNENAKKQDLAHLLNMKFQFAPRQTNASHYPGSGRSLGVNGNKRRFTQSRGHLSKDHYLQANCQFVVKGDGDYSPYLSDPDLMVPWESIEQIRIWGSEVGSCPICLHQPVAAKMTRCGHIYCWPCVLHFLALSDKPSRPCPICDSAIRVGDLRSVIALEQRAFAVGDAIELKLMKRERYSLQPQPVRRTNPNQIIEAYAIHHLKHGEDLVFNKLLACTPGDVLLHILPDERRELEKQYEDEKDCPESCFIQQALELLASRERSTQDLLGGASALAHALETLNLDEGYQVSEAAKEGVECEDAAAMGNEKIFNEAFDVEVDLATQDIQDDSQRAEAMAADPALDHHYECPEGAVALPVYNPERLQHHKSVFYFYQSSDGQAIYLHPINVQMLVRHYGSLEASPETIQGRIVEIESLSMSEELRNRMRYLGHVPLSKHFQIVEIALGHPIVPATVLEEFQDRVNDRERRRQRRHREELKRDLEIQRAEEAKWGRSQSQPIMPIDSQLHFPDFSPGWFDASSLSPGGVIEHPVDDEPGSSENGRSFAQMLRQGKQTVAWPSLGNSQPKPAVTMMRSSKSTPSFATKHDSDEDNEDYIPPPDYKQTFSSALAAALDEAAIRKGNDNMEQKTTESKSGRKGKKARQKVLFSTGMNFI